MQRSRPPPLPARWRKEGSIIVGVNRFTGWAAAGDPGPPHRRGSQEQQARSPQAEGAAARRPSRLADLKKKGRRGTDSLLDQGKPCNLATWARSQTPAGLLR